MIDSGELCARGVVLGILAVVVVVLGRSSLEVVVVRTFSIVFWCLKSSRSWPSVGDSMLKLLFWYCIRFRKRP